MGERVGGKESEEGGSVSKQKASEEWIVRLENTGEICNDAVRWCCQQRSYLEAWQRCKRADWLIFLFDRLDCGMFADTKKADRFWKSLPRCTLAHRDRCMCRLDNLTVEQIRVWWPKPPALPRKRRVDK